MAGIIGSATYGVAKQTMIYAVKVLDANGNGDWSTIISGLQFAVNDSRGRYCPNGVVINMSLGGGKSQAMDDAVAATINAGLPGTYDLTTPFRARLLMCLDSLRFSRKRRL